MKKSLTTLKNGALCLFTVLSFASTAQNVGINASGANPDPSAMLDVSASNKGLLIPNVALSSTTDVTTIPSPATSLLVYNTNASITGTGAGGAGYYYYNGTAWVRMSTGSFGPLTGDVTTVGNAATVADNAVDGTDISLTGESNGSIMYHNGTDWITLAPGTAGRVLQTNGAAAPSWVNKVYSVVNPIWWSTNIVGSYAYVASTTTGHWAVSTGPGGWNFPTATTAALNPSTSTIIQKRYVDGSGINSLYFSESGTVNSLTLNGIFNVTNNGSTATGDIYNFQIIRFTPSTNTNGAAIASNNTTTYTGTLLGASGSITNAGPTNDYKINVSVPSFTVNAGDVVVVWLSYNTGSTTSSVAKTIYMNGTISYKMNVQ